MRRKMINPLDKKWEFETNEGWLADMFLRVLEMFHVYPYDTYIPSFLDMSNIEFRTTRAKRLQIEYVFLRYVNKEHWRVGHLVEFDGSEEGYWYAIY